MLNDIAKYFIYFIIGFSVFCFLWGKSMKDEEEEKDFGESFNNHHNRSESYLQFDSSPPFGAAYTQHEESSRAAYECFTCHKKLDEDDVYYTRDIYDRDDEIRRCGYCKSSDVREI